MLQINEERYFGHKRGRGVNWCAVYWMAMLAAIVLLWYAIVGMLIEEGAGLGTAPAIADTALQASTDRCANLTTLSCPAYVFHLASPRPAHHAAPAGGPRRRSTI